MRQLKLERHEKIDDKRPFFEALRTGEGFRAFSVDDKKIEYMAERFGVEIEDLGWSGYRRSFEEDDLVTSVEELDTVYEVGQWVEFDRVLIKKRVGSRCYFVRAFEDGMPYKGRVTGVTHRKGGRIISGSWETLPGFEQEVSCLAWEVKRGLKNKPVKVHPDDLTEIKVPDGETLPILQQNNPYTESLSDTMSEIMEDWPRDEQGRWVPKD